MTEDLKKLTKKQLIEKLSNQQKSEASSGRVSFTDHEDEIEKINKLSNISNPLAIPFRVIDDHKNIMLYTALNKRVGPLHPDNARRTMNRWKRAGVQLYTTPRTQEQIDAFKETDEYKKAKIKHDALRKLRHSQSSKGKTEHMMQEIAKITANAVAGKKNE